MLLIYIKLGWELWFKALSSTIKRATVSKNQMYLQFLHRICSSSNFQVIVSTLLVLRYTSPRLQCHVTNHLQMISENKTYYLYIYTVFLKCFLMSDVQEKIYIFVRILTQNLLSQSLQGYHYVHLTSHLTFVTLHSKYDSLTKVMQPKSMFWLHSKLTDVLLEKTGLCGKSFQTHYLMSIYQITFGMPKSVWGAKTFLIKFNT